MELCSMFATIMSLLYLCMTRSYSMNTTESSPESSPESSSTTIVFTSTEMQDEQHTFSAPWIYTMEGAGSIGIILIAFMAIHASFQLYKNELSGKYSRVVYVIFFASYWLTCVAYTFFRTDLILPMGIVIPCTFGFLLGTNSIFVAKLFLFIIFLLRIDLAFHSSALGYSRFFLAFIMILYIITICLLNAAFIWDAMGLIDLYDSSLTPINVCTTGNSSDYYMFIVGSMGFLDSMFSLLVGMLFVCKLHTVNKLTQDQRSDSKNKSRAETKKMNSLSKLMRKQTILVLLAVITSVITFGLGAVFVGFSLMMPFDAILNVFCVWLMFRFSDNVWNKITGCFCYCCRCCGKKDDFLMTMHSFSSRISIHSQTGTGGTQRSNTVTRTNHSEKHETPGPITQRESAKQKDIQIKFDNDITSKDLNDIKKKNKKKIKIVTTTTTTTTNTTTVKKEVIEENSIDSPNSVETPNVSNGSENADNVGYPNESHKINMHNDGSESYQKEIHIELQENKDT